MPYSLLQALNISRQDMINRLLGLDVTSNNLANVNTTGFKTSRTNFQELLDAKNRDGMTVAGNQALTHQGALRTTGRSLDWAIEGEGYFQVQMPDGTTGYTRDGQFQLDADRQLVNASGYPLVWDGEIPADLQAQDFGVKADGTIQAVDAAGQTHDLGKVELARFANPSALLGNGKNVWLVSNDSGQPQVGAPGADGLGWVKTHVYEQSNINLAEEMTNLMTLQRSFQMSVRAFQQTDTMITEAIHMRKG